MVNILSGKEIVREFLQDNVTSENIFEEGMKILKDKIYREEMENNFIKLREILTDKDASLNAAKLISQYLI